MYTLKYSLASALLLTLVGCGGSSGGGSGGSSSSISSSSSTSSLSSASSSSAASETKTFTIDATSQSAYAYFSFESGSVVTPADAKDDGAWDLAFKRTAFIMNGGDSGTKGVQMAFTGNNADFYDAAGEPKVEVFNAATAQTELPDFMAVSAASATTDFSSDSFTPAITGDGSQSGWWLYDPSTHQVSGNDDLYFLVRSGAQANGKYAYATLRGKGFASSGSDRNVTLGLRVQTSAMATGFLEEQEAVFALTAANSMMQCYHFDTQATNDCSADWDIKVRKNGSSYVIHTNGGESGSGAGRAFDIGSNPDTYGGSETSLSGDLSAIATPYWLSDVMASSYGKYSAEYGWGEYSLNGNNKIHPNYRVYLLKSADKTYAFQILGYYHPENLTSGYITFRYREVH